MENVQRKEHLECDAKKTLPALVYSAAPYTGVRSPQDLWLQFCTEPSSIVWVYEAIFEWRQISD